MKKTPFFSIVIPTLNEAVALPLLLEDIAQQSYQDFEVIHVDGNSKDKTVEIAASFKKTLDLQTLEVKKRNVSFQRNTGGKQASGKWILFMDADNRLPRYFLDGLRYQIAKHPTCDLFTTWITTDEKKQMYKVIVKAINATFELLNSSGKPVSFGAFIGVKKTVFDTVTFDEKQKVVEDCLFVQEASKAGHHFTSFKEPQYTYSLRRLKKEGNLKMAYTTAKIQLRFLLGDDFDKNNYGYEMKGGGYYTNKTPSFMRNLHDFISKSSRKQLKQTRTLLKDLF